MTFILKWFHSDLEPVVSGQDPCAYVEVRLLLSLLHENPSPPGKGCRKSVTFYSELVHQTC